MRTPHDHRPRLHLLELRHHRRQAVAPPRRRPLGVRRLLVAHRKADMTLGTLAAIRAIVAVHATYNRDRLLAHLDAAIERERVCQPGATSTHGEESSTMEGQVKTTLEGGAGNAEHPRGPRHQRTGLEFG